jgi:hypothetical protein
LSGGLKTAIEETWQSKGAVTMICASAADVNCGQIGASFPPATTNVASIVSNVDGTIVITYVTTLLGAAANTLVMAPWDGSAVPPAPVALNVAPVGAPASVPGTTVLAKYLPATCR